MFIIDGVEDIDNWVYILIIVYYRWLNEVYYDVYFISYGYFIMNKDVFNQYYDVKYIMYKVGNFVKNVNCYYIGFGVIKVYVKVIGMNYNGFYMDYVLVDERQFLFFGLIEVGVKKFVGKILLKVYIFVYDLCGRSCKVWCLVVGFNLFCYRLCLGMIGVILKGFLMYSFNIGDVYFNMYDFLIFFLILFSKKIFLVFYCDQSEVWLWDV